jgi:HEAT repeat protein
VVNAWQFGLLLTLLAIAGVLIVVLLLCGWWRNRRAVRTYQVELTLEPMLQSWVDRSPWTTELDWLNLLSAADRRVLLRLCIRMLPNLPSDAGERARRALRHAGLVEWQVARLQARSPAERAEACAILGRLGLADAVPLLVERLGDRDARVRRRAIAALADLQAVEQLDAIAEAIEATGEWGNLLVVMALVRMGPASVSRIGALLENSRSPAMTKALLQVTGRLGLTHDPPAVRALAMHPDPEIRIEAVRTLGSIAPAAESVTTCLAAMEDSEWPARALAAWSLGRLGDERAIPRLQRAMGDPAYWVRHHTAEAIAAMGEVGQAALRRCLDDANPFVRDMATQALFMRSIRQEGAA